MRESTDALARSTATTLSRSLFAHRPLPHAGKIKKKSAAHRTERNRLAALSCHLSFPDHDNTKKICFPSSEGRRQSTERRMPPSSVRVCADESVRGSRRLSAPRLRHHDPFLPRLRERLRKDAPPPFGAHASTLATAVARSLSPGTNPFPKPRLGRVFSPLGPLAFGWHRSVQNQSSPWTGTREPPVPGLEFLLSNDIYGFSISR